MKKLLIFCLAIILAIPVGAVLKERDLARTLGVLRAELEQAAEQQRVNMARYSQMQTSQHAQLVDYMQRSEQIALMLYSQKQDFTFDVAYACQQATDLYRELSGKTIPYAKIQDRLQSEIDRYDRLIVSLQNLPPVCIVEEDGHICYPETEKKHHNEAGHHHEEIESNDVERVDSIADSLGVADTTAAAIADSVKQLVAAYTLTKNQQQDRDTCLAIAFRLRANLMNTIESVNADNLYYTTVSAKVDELNTYAQNCYKNIQKSIFINGGDNYFALLNKLPFILSQTRNDVSSKYGGFKDKDSRFSDWRGPIVNFVLLFILLWSTIATILSNVVLRLVPNRYLPEDFQAKRRLYFTTLGMLFFAVAVMILRTVIHQNFVLLATGLIVNIVWLGIAVFLSLIIRTNAAQLRSCVRVYTPFIMMAFLVIMIRILFVPNTVVNLVYPPILLIFCWWQVRTMRSPKGTIPSSDIIYSSVSMIAMVVATVLAWTGYVLFAVEIMMWWMFQLAAIQTLASIYYLLERYEIHYVLTKIRTALEAAYQHALTTEDPLDDEQTLAMKNLNDKEVLKKAHAGEFIQLTWFFDFINRALVPILAVYSSILSIWYAADIFELTDALRSFFYYNFVNEEGMLQLSLSKLVIVVVCWFVFRYINYVARSVYHHVKRLRTNLRPEQYNFTLANNVISIFVWGSYILYALYLLQVPKSGISVVGAGLATGMGFAMKDLLENFFYGISLMTGRIRVGDYIECDGILGRVESITYQSTQIITLDGSVIAFLNTQLFSKNFKNLTRNHHYELVKIPVGVAYGADVEQVRRLLVEAIAPLDRTLEDGRQLLKKDSPISVVFADFGASSVDLVITYWVLVDQKTAFAGRVKEVVYNTLNEHNIEIPFPQCDVHMR